MTSFVNETLNFKVLCANYSHFFFTDKILRVFLIVFAILFSAKILAHIVLYVQKDLQNESMTNDIF